LECNKLLLMLNHYYNSPTNHQSTIIYITYIYLYPLSLIVEIPMKFQPSGCSLDSLDLRFLRFLHRSKLRLSDGPRKSFEWVS